MFRVTRYPMISKTESGRVSKEIPGSGSGSGTRWALVLAHFQLHSFPGRLLHLAPNLFGEFTSWQGWHICSDSGEEDLFSLQVGANRFWVGQFSLNSMVENWLMIWSPWSRVLACETLCASVYSVDMEGMQSVRMNWKVSGQYKKCPDNLENVSG